MSLVYVTAQLLDHASQVLAYAPTPDPTPSFQPKTVNTDGMQSFFAFKIAPVLLGVLGVIFIARANRGEVSKVITSSAIAVIGCAFLLGAGGLLLFGGSLTDLLFK